MCAWTLIYALRPDLLDGETMKEAGERFGVGKVRMQQFLRELRIAVPDLHIDTDTGAVTSATRPLARIASAGLRCSAGRRGKPARRKCMPSKTVSGRRPHDHLALHPKRIRHWSRVHSFRSRRRASRSCGNGRVCACGSRSTRRAAGSMRMPVGWKRAGRGRQLAVDPRR